MAASCEDSRMFATTQLFSANVSAGQCAMRAWRHAWRESWSTRPVSSLPRGARLCTQGDRRHHHLRQRMTACGHMNHNVTTEYPGARCSTHVMRVGLHKRCRASGAIIERLSGVGTVQVNSWQIPEFHRCGRFMIASPHGQHTHTPLCACISYARFGHERKSTRRADSFCVRTKNCDQNTGATSRRRRHRPPLR